MMKMGRFQKLISVSEGACAGPEAKILGHPHRGSPVVSCNYVTVWQMGHALEAR